MAIEIVSLTLGLVQTNCYILGDTATSEAVVIDPADSAPVILSAAAKRDWTIRLLLATHAHFDHVLAVGSLREATGAPFRLHEADMPLLQAIQLTGQWFGLELPPPPQVDGRRDGRRSHQPWAGSPWRCAPRRDIPPAMWVTCSSRNGPSSAGTACLPDRWGGRICRAATMPC